MVLKCKCGGDVIDADGESVCERCGIVCESRAEMPSVTLSDIGVRRTQNTKGWKLSKAARMIYTKKSDMDTHIESACTKLALPDAVYRRAIFLHRQMMSHGLHHGWDIPARTCAVICAACRLESVPRAANKICDVVGVKPGRMWKVYGQLIQGLSLRIPEPDPISYITSIASAANVPELIRRRAAEIIREHKVDVDGKDPTVLAAAAIYVAACSYCRRGEKPCVSQEKLALISGVSSVSIRLRRKDLGD